MNQENLKTFEVESSVDNLELINNYIEDLLSQMNVSMKTIYSILIAFEEIFVNICLYAYKEDINGQIKINIKTSKDSIRIQIEDNGIPYNPLEKEDPDITAPIEDRDIGGLGIFIAKKNLDFFDYRNEEGKNISILCKKLN